MREMDRMQNWRHLASGNRTIGDSITVFSLLAALTGSALETSAQTYDCPKGLVASIYAMPIKNLEWTQGRSNFSRVCNWLTERFSKGMLTADSLPCKLKNYGVDFRYPSLSSENIEDLADEVTPLQAQIIEESVEAGKATVKVQTPVGGDLPAGRIVYFLTKEERGWKIYNFLSYSAYPLKTSRQYSDCKDMSREYKFAQRPTSAYELQDLPAACKKVEQRRWQNAATAQ
jgi:hypothetical protein